MITKPPKTERVVERTVEHVPEPKAPKTLMNGSKTWTGGVARDAGIAAIAADVATSSTSPWVRGVAVLVAVGALWAAVGQAHKLRKGE